MKAKPKKMKVHVCLTVDVDLDDYRLNYGADTVKDIRFQVKHAVLGAVTSGGVLADGLVGATLNNP